MMRILILGGTTEASALAVRLAGDDRFAPILSLAGRTTAPKAQPVPVRVGGFGGISGLVEWLEQQRIEAIIDATHPYAARISRNAVAAAARLALPLASVVRAPWRQVAGDNWLHADDVPAAVAGLGGTPKRVFLSLGRLELGAFASQPQHDYLARLIEPPDGIVLPPRIRCIFARGPFDPDGERRLLLGERIDVVVSKNSGGAATYGKVAAARSIGIRVVMIARPEKPCGETVDGAGGAHTWLCERAGHLRTPVHSLRGE